MKLKSDSQFPSHAFVGWRRSAARSTSASIPPPKHCHPGVCLSTFDVGVLQGVALRTIACGYCAVLGIFSPPDSEVDPWSLGFGVFPQQTFCPLPLS